MSTQTQPRFRALYHWRLSLLYMGLIFVASSIETQAPIVQHFPLRDKGVHFVVYAVLGWLCAAASARTWPKLPGLLTGAFAVCVATLWGFSDELHQYFVPGRTAELADLLADSLGSFVGVVGQHMLSREPWRRMRRAQTQSSGHKDLKGD